jgi:DHA1 family bicyclomycin/chloramphenicol resistance-like MFS transporter
MLGLAAGHLLVGPLSDRFGRRRPLLGALAAYVVSCLVCAAAPSVEVLIAARLLQGVAGAGGIVIGRAVVRDLHDGPAAVRLFSGLVAVTSVTTVVAPLIGGQVLLVGTWRDVLVAQAVIGLALLAATALVVPETLPPRRRRPERPAVVVRAAARLLRDPVVLGFSLACGLIYGAMLTAIAGSGFVLQRAYGVSEAASAALLATCAAGLIAGARANARLAAGQGPRRLLAGGVASSLAGGVTALAAAAAGLGLAVFVAGLALSFASHALTLPNASALVLARRPDALGSASAALGVTQYAVGGACAPLAGLVGGTSAIAMALTIVVLATGAAGGALLGARGGKDVPAPGANGT